MEREVARSEDGGGLQESDGDASTQVAPELATEVFLLSGSARSLRATGCLAALPPGRATTLDARVRDFFASARPGPGFVALALPFDRRGDAVAFQPQRITVSEPLVLVRESEQPVPTLSITEEPSAEVYANDVERALARIADPARTLRKVVLARSLRITALGSIARAPLLGRLASDRSVTTFLIDLSRATGIAGHAMIGATPELLVARDGLAVRSHPLAGSAPRSRNRKVDRAAAERLLRSEKDRREHAVVVEAVLDTLAPHCAALSTPGGMSLRSTATMWHLGTRIEGKLRNEDAPSAAGLAALLHPTPAVGGDPRDAALAAIEAIETHVRGFYAGAVGWTDRTGNGEVYVTLRCAELMHHQAVLHAGAGIVAGSVPALEVEETSAKFRAMLDALGLDAAALGMEAT